MSLETICEVMGLKFACMFPSIGKQCENHDFLKQFITSTRLYWNQIQALLTVLLIYISAKPWYMIDIEWDTS